MDLSPEVGDHLQVHSRLGGIREIDHRLASFVFNEKAASIPRNCDPAIVGVDVVGTFYFKALEEVSRVGWDMSGRCYRLWNHFELGVGSQAT